MAPAGDTQPVFGEAGYLARHDLEQSHLRRVRLIVFATSALMAVLGAAFAIFFVARSAHLVAAMNAVFIGLGISLYAVAASGHVRGAAKTLLFSLLLILLGNALLVDVPTTQVARSIHYYFPVLAVVGYFVLRGEDPWLLHGFPSACLIVFVLTAGGNLGVEPRLQLPEADRPAVWLVSAAAMGVLLLLMHIFMGDINRMENFLHSANNRFVGLVRGMFPAVIAERLLATGEAFSERHANCSILFADIVGFTSLTERLPPEELVSLLADVFAQFDECVERLGVTKIKTIGDAYMAAAGVPSAHPDHAGALVECAREMLAVIQGKPGLALRIGIASGDLVAGVIGQTRQVYDVWGDAVNTASRMESHGVPGRIQVSEATYRLTHDRFIFEQRSEVAIKGKTGTHNVYLLVQPKEA